MRHAGRDLHLTVTGLEPFTTYQLRVQACQLGNHLNFIISCFYYSEYILNLVHHIHEQINEHFYLKENKQMHRRHV